MGRLLLRIAITATVALVMLTSCNEVYYVVPALTATVPLNDNSQSNCAMAPSLLPASLVAPRVMHVKYIQNGKTVKEVSITSTAGKSVTFPRVYVPSAAKVTAICWASNSRGPGCEKSLPLTPTVTTKAP
jgi:hypothetical protein